MEEEKWWSWSGYFALTHSFEKREREMTKLNKIKQMQKDAFTNYE